MSSVSAEQRSGSHWLMFAAVMILIAGAFNAADGIAALASAKYFAADKLLFGNLTFWGWVWLIVGACQLAIATLIFKKSAFGMIVGIFLAGFSGMAHLLSVGAYPIWSITVMVIDFLIIYGLVVALDEFDR